jgi:hypothetical protein
MPRHDVSVRGVAVGGTAIGVTVALVIAAVLFTLHEAGVPPGGARLTAPGVRVQVPGPALQSAPQIDLQRYRAEKQRLLDARGWADPRHQTARIPIASAMALLADGAASAPGAQR